AARRPGTNATARGTAAAYRRRAASAATDGAAGAHERGSILSQPNGAQGQPLRRVEDLRSERHEEQLGNQLIIREPGRVIVRDGGGQAISRASPARSICFSWTTDATRRRRKDSVPWYSARAARWT